MKQIKEKCDGCKRAEGSDTIYTCNCGVEQPKEVERVESAKEFLDKKSTYGVWKEDGDYIHKDCVIDLLTEYATQHKAKEQLNR